MTRHYVLFEDNTTKGAWCDLTDLGTDAEKALAKADSEASRLTACEMKNRDAFELIACDIPDNTDTEDEEFNWLDYSKETIKDYIPCFATVDTYRSNARVFAQNTSIEVYYDGDYCDGFSTEEYMNVIRGQIEDKFGVGVIFNLDDVLCQIEPYVDPFCHEN